LATADRAVPGERDRVLPLRGPDYRYFLAHADGCRDCDAPLAPGDPFCFDTDTGDVLCMDHGTAREDHEQREGDEPDAAD